ncbi:MAG TPA: hypothetical protein VFQ06_15015, partial [Nitrospira sp.]|nr:hypothetical protein [Nitrospira sp.]
MYSTTQLRSGHLGADTPSHLYTALKRTRRLAAFGLLFATSACDVSTTAPEQAAVSHKAPVTASISFGRLATDNEVITFLSRHNISATAVYMYSAGLHGTDHLPPGQEAATV